MDPQPKSGKVRAHEYEVRQHISQSYLLYQAMAGSVRGTLIRAFAWILLVITGCCCCRASSSFSSWMERSHNCRQTRQNQGLTARALLP